MISDALETSLQSLNHVLFYLCYHGFLLINKLIQKVLILIFLVNCTTALEVRFYVS